MFIILIGNEQGFSSHHILLAHIAQILIINLNIIL